MHQHISTVRAYFTIFAILMACTFLTYYVRVGLGIKSFGIAITIAVFKATLVILYFMHVKWAQTLTKAAVVTAVVFLGILLLFVSTDYTSRNWQPNSAGWEKQTNTK